MELFKPTLEPDFRLKNGEFTLLATGPSFEIN
jgi:hypothetical protein